jgi:hypothetical protein
MENCLIVVFMDIFSFTGSANFNFLVIMGKAFWEFSAVITGNVW